MNPGLSSPSPDRMKATEEYLLEPLRWPTDRYLFLSRQRDGQNQKALIRFEDASRAVFRVFEYSGTMFSPALGDCLARYNSVTAVLSHGWVVESGAPESASRPV